METLELKSGEKIKMLTGACMAEINPRVHGEVCETLYGVSPNVTPTVFNRSTPNFLTFIFLG